MARHRSIWAWSVGVAIVMCLTTGPRREAQAPDSRAAADEIVRADAAFARPVATKDRQAFVTFLAEAVTSTAARPAKCTGATA